MFMQIIKYGQYPQVDNKVLPIEWYVLSEWAGKLLLISKYALDWCPFHYNFGSCVLWKDSTIRKWLNKDFYLLAFSMEEKENIVSTSISQLHDNSRHWGKSTEVKDKVFLLSANELREFMPENVRGCSATDFALNKFKYENHTYKRVESGKWRVKM